MTLKPLRSVILLPDRNTKTAAGKIKSDWSGAFRPEALLFAKIHRVKHIYQIDVSKSAAVRKRYSFECIAQAHHLEGGPLQLIAIFCHGWINGIQFGWTRANCKSVAQHLAQHCTSELTVALYCCSTAATDSKGPGGDGGFADTMRDALCRAGVTHCQIDAHDTPGHTTRNPRVVRFRGQGSPIGAQGGQWIVEPGKQPLWRVWTKGLHNPKNTLRLRYPLMTVAGIHSELVAPAAQAA